METNFLSHLEISNCAYPQNLDTIKNDISQYFQISKLINQTLKLGGHALMVKTSNGPISKPDINLQFSNMPDIITWGSSEKKQSKTKKNKKQEESNKIRRTSKRITKNPKKQDSEKRSPQNLKTVMSHSKSSTTDYQKNREKDFDFLMLNGILFRKKFLVRSGLDDKLCPLEYSVEDYWFLFQFLSRNMLECPQNLYAMKQLLRSISVSFMDIKDNKKFDSKKYDEWRSFKEKWSLFLERMNENLVFLSKFQKDVNFKWLNEFKKKVQHFLNSDKKDWRNFDYEISLYQRTNFLQDYINFIGKVLTTDESFSTRSFIEHLSKKNTLTMIQKENIKILNESFDNLMELKKRIGVKDFSDKEQEKKNLISKNVVLANLVLKFEEKNNLGKKMKKYVKIPVYYPEIDRTDIYNLTEKSLEFVTETVKNQMDALEEETKMEIEENQNRKYDENHSEKTLLGFLYQYGEYFSELIGQQMKKSKLNISQLRKIVLHVYSTRICCPSCKSFLSNENTFQTILRTLINQKIYDLDKSELDETNVKDLNETLNNIKLRIKLSYTLPPLNDPEINQAKKERNREKKEKRTLIIDTEEKDFFNFKLLFGFLKNDQIKLIKSTFFVSTAPLFRLINSNIYDQEKEIENIIAKNLNYKALNNSALFENRLRRNIISFDKINPEIIDANDNPNIIIFTKDFAFSNEEILEDLKSVFYFFNNFTSYFYFR